MMLRAYLSVLLVNKMKFSDTSEKFKQLIKERWNEEYNIQQIEEELEILAIENAAMEQLDHEDLAVIFPEDF